MAWHRLARRVIQWKSRRPAELGHSIPWYQTAYETTPFGAPVARLTRVRWLTPGEVAARLQVCRATVYKLCDARQLGYARVSLSIRISEQELEAFLSARGASQR